MRAIALACVVFSIPAVLHSEVTYQPAPRGEGSPWTTDTVWVGADIVSAAACTVKVVRCVGFSMAIGGLYFVWPDKADSCRFLFHNRPDLYPNEPNEVTLGVFRPGTRLIFMYTVVDSVGRYAQFAGKRLYSGQCRKGTDVYISDGKPEVFGYRSTVVGRCDDTSVMVGFNDRVVSGFCAVIFRVTCAMLVR